MTEQQKEKITEMRRNGIGYGQIAVTLQVPESAVKSYCRRHLKSKQVSEHSADHCMRCGKQLINTPGHRQKSFCSVSCQQKYWQEHRDLMQHPSYVTITCPACGHSFSDYAGHKRKYCSHACYINDRYGRNAVYETKRNDLSHHNEAVSENAEKPPYHRGEIR